MDFKVKQRTLKSTVLCSLLIYGKCQTTCVCFCFCFKLQVCPQNFQSKWFSFFFFFFLNNIQIQATQMRQLNGCNVYCHLIEAESLPMTDLFLAVFIDKKGQGEIKYIFCGLSEVKNEIFLRWCLINNAACCSVQIDCTF